MSIATEITRLQNSKADVKTQVNVDKDLINGGTAFIGSETVDDYDDKIEEMQEAYKKFIPIQTASGTEITLDNSNDDKVLVDIGLDGNTEQETTTGKNISYFTYKSNRGITFDGNDITIINPTNYLYVGTNWNLKDDTSLSGKTYTIYAIANGTTSGNNTISLIISKTNSSYAYQLQFPSGTTTYKDFLKVATITLGANEVFDNMSIYVPSSDTANLNIKIMIVEGSYTAQTIGDYEPYTGRNCLT